MTQRTMGDAMRIEWLDGLDQIETLRDEWLRLEASVVNRTVFSTYDWVVPWYRDYFAARGEPCVGVAWEGGRLVGVAPLVCWRGTLGKIPLRRVDFASHTGDAGEVLVADGRVDVVSRLFDSLLSGGGIDAVCLNGFTPESEAYRAIRDGAGRRGFTVEISPYRYAVVDLQQGYEAYCRSMSGNFRRNLKRHAARFAAAGPSKTDRLHATSTDEEVSTFLGRMFRIADSSWKAKVDGPMATHYRRFYEEVTGRFARRGMADLAILSVGGHDVAFILGLVERGVYYDVSVSFDDAFQELSPGLYLMQEVLRGCPKLGIHTVVSHGDHDYKARWASAFVQQSCAYLFSPRMRGLLSRATKFVLPRALGRLRRAE